MTEKTPRKEQTRKQTSWAVSNIKQTCEKGTDLGLSLSFFLFVLCFCGLCFLGIVFPLFLGFLLFGILYIWGFSFWKLCAFSFQLFWTFSLSLFIFDLAFSFVFVQKEKKDQKKKKKKKKTKKKTRLQRGKKGTFSIYIYTPHTKKTKKEKSTYLSFEAQITKRQNKQKNEKEGNTKGCLVWRISILL